MARLYDTGIFSANATNGAVGVGYKLYFYTTGTTTPKNTYPTRADAVAGTNANANPMVAAADGRWSPIWLTGGDYKVVLKDFDDVTLETRDPADTNIEWQLSATTGTDLIGYGSETLTQFLGRRIPFIEDYDVTAGSGNATTDTAAFATAAAAGKFQLTAGKTYKLNSRISLLDRAGVIGNNATIQLQTDSGHFDYAVYGGAGAYGTRHVAFLADTKTDVEISGINFTFSSNASIRCCIPIAYRTCTRGIIKDITIDGTGLTNYIPYRGMVSVQSCTSTIVQNIYGANCTNTSSSLVDGSGTPTTGQTTLVEVDNDRPSGNSLYLLIKDVRAYDFRASGGAATAWGQQSDCVNIQSQGFGYGRVEGVFAEYVGETLDLWGSGWVAEDIRGKNVMLSHVKMIHGASYNKVDGVMVNGTGFAVVHLNNSAVGDCQFNSVTNVIGNDVGILHDTYCASLSLPSGVIFDAGNVTTSWVRYNSVEGRFDGYETGGSYKMLAAAQQISQAGNNKTAANAFSGIATDYQEGGNSYFTKSTNTNGTLKVSRSVKARVYAYLGSNTAYADSATIIFNSIAADPTGEYDNTTGIWTCKSEGNYEIKAQATTGTVSSPNTAGLAILQGATTVLTKSSVGAGGAIVTDVSLTLYLYPGDTIKVAAKSSSGSPTLTGAQTSTFLQIMEV